MMASLVSSSLKTGRLIFIWSPGFQWGCQPWCGCLDPPDLSDCVDTNEAVDIELWLLSNPGSSEGEGNQGRVVHCYHCLLPQSWPLCGTWPHSWCTGWGPSLGTFHHSAATRLFADQGGQILVMEIEWCGSIWDWMRMTRPSWFDVSFSGHLGDQPLTITQACWLGTELGLFANPTDGTWQCKHGVSCLAKDQSFS